MNRTEAYLFQSNLHQWEVVMVWEKGDIEDYMDMTGWKCIGTVQYDINERKIIE